jgi:hypothetical protein
MTRTEWISNYCEEKRNLFNIALQFYSLHNKRKKCRKQFEVADKYRNPSKSKNGVIPTEGEFNLLVNNKYFKRLVNKVTNPKYNVGDIVCIKMQQAGYLFVEKAKYKMTAGVVVKVDIRIDYIWYEIKMFNDPNNTVYEEQNRVKKIEFRNLDKNHRRR